MIETGTTATAPMRCWPDRYALRVKVGEPPPSIWVPIRVAEMQRQRATWEWNQAYRRRMRS